VVNRGALILRYKEPAVRWINEADPSPSDSPITLQQVNDYRGLLLRNGERGLPRARRTGTGHTVAPSGAGAALVVPTRWEAEK
jgi:hypothetical protein